ncbi:MAG: 30S ribosomal protein S12 methylthiotransferase RimO [Coriobacteriia bacterium]
MQTTPGVAFITLGCPKNEVDTDRMRASVDGSAFRVEDDPGLADVVVVNTCSFIAEATEESIATILDLLGDKSGGPSPKLVVAGCMPARYGEDLPALLPEVSAFVPVADESGLLEVLERLTGLPAYPDATAPTRTVSGATAYLQIADGCHRHCSYCTIPAIRGPYVSRPLADILAETRELVALGAREIVLIGQDTSAYGRDLVSTDTLADVVRAVAAVSGVAWLRLMYVQPDGITDDLLAAIAENPNVVRYLDMPLQHASASVLRAMHRSGDAAAFLDLVARVRLALPGVVLRTTIIAGHPGEGAADFATLLNFLEQASLDYVGVFAYSPEEGTDAAILPHQVPARTRRARAQRVRDAADAISVERATGLVGQVLEVLVSGIDPDEGVVVGRWRGQAPEIDGLVLLDRGEPGQIVSARIVDSIGYDLEGEVL